MKRMTKITTLLLALMMVLAMSQSVFAASGGTYTFDGSQITQSGGDIKDAISGLQPGDSVDIEFVYENDSDDSTEWYLRNEVLDSLKDAAEDNGGYTYKLTNYGETGTTEIFDSNAVGGDENYEPDGIAKGLLGATDATDEFFHIDTLAKGQSGRTVLTVGFDGESQGNAYENSNAVVEIQYAVELSETGETIYKHVNRGVKTGDDTNIILPLAVFLGGLLLLVLGLISRRKERKDGEEA